MSRFALQVQLSWFDGLGWFYLIVLPPRALVQSGGFFDTYDDARGAAVAFCRAHAFAFEVIE
jgi:hypothetical protein